MMSWQKKLFGVCSASVLVLIHGREADIQGIFFLNNDSKGSDVANAFETDRSLKVGRNTTPIVKEKKNGWMRRRFSTLKWDDFLTILDQPLLSSVPHDENFTTHGNPGNYANYSPGDPIVMIVYHKTGSVFAEQYLHLRHRLTNETYYEASEAHLQGHSVDWVPKDSVHPSKALLQRVAMPRVDVPLPAAGPVIIWVRAPFDLIISGYRYHIDAPEGWERREALCFGCDEQSWNDVFGVCSYTCSYLQLLREAPPEKGILIEACMERTQIDRMVRFFFCLGSKREGLAYERQSLGSGLRSFHVLHKSFSGQPGARLGAPPLVRAAEG